MKKRMLFIAVIFIMFTSASCAKKEDTVSKTIFAMDTVMEISACGKYAEKAISEAEQEILRLDTLLDRKNPESEIYAVNASGGGTVSHDTALLLRRAQQISEQTDGAFDITVAPVMDLWGFYTKNFRVPGQDELNRALLNVDFRNVLADGNTIALPENTEIDLGGIAKGFLSDRIILIFKKNNIKSAIISLGGNVAALGKKANGQKWRVAVQSPGGGGYIGVLSVSDAAVITSGGYQRFFEQDGKAYHHIIDPSTGYPAESGLKSVSIISPDGTMSDGLSTALFVMGLDKAAKYWQENEGFEAVFVTEGDEIFITEGLKDIFESEYDYSVITK